ncbi:MAG: Gfo/Idh/MocA family protein [Candidatus Dormibacteraceae bacterium]
MADRVVRFGVIGGGLMGRYFAMACGQWPMLRELDAAPELVAVCDLDPQVRAWYERNLPNLALSTADYRELLTDDRVEAVYCAVPHHLHAQIYPAVLNAGKHLLGEKPFGIDLEANRLIQAAMAAHPDLLVRVSSEFPFYPGAQRIVTAAAEGGFGRILDVRAGFHHSSDLDPDKPINWKRMASLNGEYGCLGDLGLHVVHVPFRLGWTPHNVRAILSDVVPERPNLKGVRVRCDTWDNAILLTEVEAKDGSFPMLLEARRIAPGETNTWFLEVHGSRRSMSFSTKTPRTLWTLDFTPGSDQEWRRLDLGYRGAYASLADGIFEFGFGDAVLQMWAAFVDELVNGHDMLQRFRCATPAEAASSHLLFTAALESQRSRAVVEVPVASTP